MARRGAGNPRYRKGAKVGSTRRSASAARPKRQPGSGSSASARKTVPARRASLFAPQSAEERRWRRIWWALMAVALVCVALAFLPQVRQNEGVVRVLLGVELAAVAAALALDLTKIRQARKAAAADTDTKKKADRARGRES